MKIRWPGTNRLVMAVVSAVFLWAMSRALATEGLLEAHRSLFETARWLIIGAAFVLLAFRR